MAKPREKIGKTARQATAEEEMATKSRKPFISILEKQMAEGEGLSILDSFHKHFRHLETTNSMPVAHVCSPLSRAREFSRA